MHHSIKVGRHSLKEASKSPKAFTTSQLYSNDRDVTNMEYDEVLKRSMKKKVSELIHEEENK